MSNKPNLLPQEASSRATESAVMLTYVHASLMSYLSGVYSEEEIFHIYMQFLYCMIDTMAAVNKSSVYHVLDATERYFRQLESERKNLAEDK
jgi:hypothetical protein